MTSNMLAMVGMLFFHSYEGGGILEGFLHPLLGLDHLLAMLAVGFISAQMGGRAVWTVPTAFVVLMAIGSFLGTRGVPLPTALVDYGITGSVLLLGVGIFANRNLPEWSLLVLVGLFGFFHGHAHGIEGPQILANSIAEIIAYISGLLVATIGLHVIGALIGLIMLRNPKQLLMVRGLGLIIAVIGVVMVMQV